MITLRQVLIAESAARHLSDQSRRQLESTELGRHWLAREPQEGAHVSRRLQWNASREAIAQALAQGSQDARALDGGLVPLSASVAHTDVRAQAAVLWGRLGDRSRLGVDVEESSRNLSAAVMSRLLDSAELAALGRLPAIAAWVAKEAVFKSLSPERQGILSSIRLESVALDSAATGEAYRIRIRAPYERASVTLQPFPDHWLAISHFEPG